MVFSAENCGVATWHTRRGWGRGSPAARVTSTNLRGHWMRGQVSEIPSGICETRRPPPPPTPRFHNGISSNGQGGIWWQISVAAAFLVARDPERGLFSRVDPSSWSHHPSLDHPWELCSSPISSVKTSPLRLPLSDLSCPMAAFPKSLPGHTASASPSRSISLWGFGADILGTGLPALKDLRRWTGIVSHSLFLVFFFVRTGRQPRNVLLD